MMQRLEIVGYGPVTIVALCMFPAFLLFWHFHRPFSNFPPGPPGNFLVGNLLQFKTRGAWTDLIKYKEEYGDLVFFQGLGNRILVLNSLEVIDDLLDKRAAIYSHRPLFTVVSELMGLGQSMPLLPYGKEWREHRKMAHTALGPSSVARYHSTQEDLSALLNLALLDDPDNFFAHVRSVAGRIVLAVTYGTSAIKGNEKLVTLAEETLDIIGKATVPGAFLCDLLPFLKYAPPWVPFQRKAAHGKKMIDTLVTSPFDQVKEYIAEGRASPSLTLDLLLDNASYDRAIYEHRVKWTAGSMFGAGAETTYSTVLTFILAMALNPEKQRLAQAEIDHVIGNGRLPMIGDRENLPYVQAVIKETMRWHPALPLSIARVSAKDDYYRGYFIPKDTIIVPNAWAIAFTPSEEYDVKSFIPERFLTNDKTAIDPAIWAFGFGRRICPGKALAENSVFALISSIIAAFTILPPTEGDLEPCFGVDLVSYPQPFKCQIVPRSTAMGELVRQRASLCDI